MGRNNSMKTRATIRFQQLRKQNFTLSPPTPALVGYITLIYNQDSVKAFTKAVPRRRPPYWSRSKYYITASWTRIVRKNTAGREIPLRKTAEKREKLTSMETRTICRRTEVFQLEWCKNSNKNFWLISRVFSIIQFNQSKFKNIFLFIYARVCKIQKVYINSSLHLVRNFARIFVRVLLTVWEANSFARA